MNNNYINGMNKQYESQRFNFFLKKKQVWQNIHYNTCEPGNK